MLKDKIRNVEAKFLLRPVYNSERSQSCSVSINTHTVLQRVCVCSHTRHDTQRETKGGNSDFVCVMFHDECFTTL